MNELMRSILNWAKDPFGKSKITDTHDKIILDMKLTKTEAQRLIYRSEFPIGSMIGNKDYRRRQHVRSNKRSIQ